MKFKLFFPIDAILWPKGKSVAVNHFAYKQIQAREIHSAKEKYIIYEQNKTDKQIHAIELVSSPSILDIKVLRNSWTRCQ